MDLLWLIFLQSIYKLWLKKSDYFRKPSITNALIRFPERGFRSLPRIFGHGSVAFVHGAYLDCRRRGGRRRESRKKRMRETYFLLETFSMCGHQGWTGYSSEGMLDRGGGERKKLQLEQKDLLSGRIFIKLFFTFSLFLCDPSFLFVLPTPSPVHVNIHGILWIELVIARVCIVK